MDPLLKYEHPLTQRRDPAGGFATTSYRQLPGPSLRQLAELLAQHLGQVHVIGFLEAVTFNVAYRQR